MLMVEHSTLASRVAMGTLSSGATPTLGAASSVGTFGDTMAVRSWIAICSDVAGTCGQHGDVIRGDGWRGAMAGVEAPNVGNVVSSCCRHEEAHTSVVLGGNADIIFIGAMWVPTCVDPNPRGMMGILL